MDIAAEPPQPAPSADAPEIAGRRIDWTGRDVLFGLLWFAGLFFGAQILIIPLLVIYGDTSSTFYAAAFISGAGAEVGFALVAAKFTFRRYGGGWGRLGFGPIKWSTLGWAAAAFFAALLFSAAYAVVIDLFGWDFLKSTCAEQIPKEVRDERALLALASFDVIMFAPICEEIFFRGFVFTGLTKKWGIVAGIIASGVLFAAAHLLYKSFVPIAGVGMIFAFTYWRSRNIVATIAAHFAFNSLSIAAIAAGSCDDTTTSIPAVHAVGAIAARVLG
ncbi:MAG: CPBP family intramembrane metalloprotease [Chloroflexota bacterium]|nr:CPBP family intramembrane metalloprotease [Chloroflexota bacterium]